MVDAFYPKQYQYMQSLGLKPMTLTLLASCTAQNKAKVISTHLDVAVVMSIRGMSVQVYKADLRRERLILEK